MKIITTKSFTILFCVLASILCSTSIYAGDPPTDPDPTISSGNMNGTNNHGPKSLTQEWITFYIGGGQMWFDFSDEIHGFNVTAFDTTGNCVVEYVTDDTPFAVPFTSGSTVYIVCVTNSGNTFTGQINF